jgi:hypothetical protein
MPPAVIVWAILAWRGKDKQGQVRNRESHDMGDAVADWWFDW